MADLRSRLRARFSGIPSVTDADLDAWNTEALYIYEYSPLTVALLPDKETPLVLLLAQIQGARAISFSAAQYFKYSDAEEVVDKTMVSEQYRKLAADLYAEYVREKDVIERSRRESSAFRVMHRMDRDVR